MKSILEFLKIKDIKGDSHYLRPKDNEFPDDIKPRFNKQGKPFMWWKVYELIMNNGPMSKAEALKSLGLVETSYSTAFAEYAKMNIIVPNKKTKKLEIVHPDKWKLKKVMNNGRFSGVYE